MIVDTRINIPISPHKQKRLKRTKQNFPYGQYFYGRVGAIHGLFVSSYHGIISMSNPEHTWEFNADADVANVSFVDVTIFIQGKENA